MESSVSNTEERELQQLQERHTKTRKNCSVYIELIKKHSKYLQTIRWNGWGTEEGFSRAIRRYFGDNHEHDRRALHESECLMKAQEVRAIKEIEKRLNESKMQTQEGMVNEGISLNAGLNSEASTYDNTSIKQQDGSNSLEHVADDERARVDKVVSDVENVVARPSYDNDTLIESFHKENEKYAEYVQPLLNRKNELEKTNQEFLKQINDLNNKLLKAGQTTQTFVGLRWIPTGKTVGTCINTNDSTIPLGKETFSPKTVMCANSSSFSA
ncbi:hypothetical protein Tco_0998906, partial [Tanacetum coccineum]